MQTWEELFAEADGGDLKALELCTSYCIQGDDETKPDLSKALHYALLLEENGGDSSPYFTWIYMLQKDYEHAYHAYKVAFMRGHIEQMGEMALVCYHLGRYEEAYQYAMNTEQWQGEFVLGLLYENGKYVAPNREMAHQYFCSAYEKGNEPSLKAGIMRTQSTPVLPPSKAHRNIVIAILAIAVICFIFAVSYMENEKKEASMNALQNENTQMDKVSDEMSDEEEQENETDDSVSTYQSGSSMYAGNSYNTNDYSYNYSDDYEDDYEYEDDYDDSSSEYIFPYSNTECLTSDDVKGMSATEINLAKNELYARHGRIFDRQDLQQYFESCSWYSGIYTREEWDELGDKYFFNDTEIKNRNLLVKYEKKAK